MITQTLSKFQAPALNLLWIMTGFLFFPHGAQKLFGGRRRGLQYRRRAPQGRTVRTQRAAQTPSGQKGATCSSVGSAQQYHGSVR